MKTTLHLTNLDHKSQSSIDDQCMEDKIVNIFIGNTATLIYQLKCNWRDQNWELLVKNIRIAKASFLMIGAVSTADKLEEIELRIQLYQRYDIVHLLIIIEKEAEKILFELHKPRIK